MKHFLTFFFLVASFGSLFAQKETPAGYQELMESYQPYTTDLAKAVEAIATARQTYVTTVRSLQSEASASENWTNQADWMANTVPDLIVALTDAKQQNQSIDRWTSAFRDQFGLDSKDHNAIRKDLRAYAKAYQQYVSAYTRMRTAMGDGSTPPTPPPPPPPSQQHHF